MNIVKDKLEGYSIFGDVFLTPIPHLFLEPGITVVEVIAPLNEEIN